jgi:hypothetical protein
VQYGGVSAQPARAPVFTELGDENPTPLGIYRDTIIDLKVKGVVA